MTATELRVAALVAQGLTNPEIGERMFISRGTVKVPLCHIFAKLGSAPAPNWPLVTDRVAAPS